VFLHESAGTDSSVRNDAEARHVARLVRELLAGGVVPEEIGVITPFRAQAARVRQLLGTAGGGAEWHRRVLVDTVERFQGQEREVILITLAASQVNFISRRADFIFQPERLNVAVTRARLKTVLLASHSLLACAEALADAGHEGAACFSSLVAHLRSCRSAPSL
jgi:DNA replication ATP-dependent helicase Dna2